MLSKALSHIADRLLPQKTSQRQLDDFDPVFYRNCYSDLYHLKFPRALRKHYLLHGLREGRWKNLAEATKNLESRFGQLPEDFNANSYRLLNEDLAQAFDHECQFVLHYLEHGRKEGRRYKVENYSALDKTNAWKTLFRLADFIACAQSWLDEIPQTKEQGIRIFFDVGIERLAPLHLDHVFDPAFYRSAYGYDESATDAALYRHWLEIGVSEGQSANEAMALKNITGSRQYPKSFDWQRYKSALPNKEAKSLTHRVNVLEHLFKTGFERGMIKYITGITSDELFISIGDYHLIRSHYHLAIAAFDRARALNPSSYDALHHRGDAYAALGNTVAAHADFVQAIANPYARVWSTIHAARTAAVNGSFGKSFGILAQARPKWSGSAEYRKTVSDIIDQFFVAKTRAAMALYDAEDRHAADACMFGALDEVRERIVQLEDLPSSVPRAPNGQVAILANQDLAQCKHYRVEQKVRQLQFAGLKAQAFDQHDPTPFLQSLLGARAAIFYRVPAFPNIIRAILTAKALGIPTYYEVDDLIFDAAHYPDTFESYEGQISKAEYNGLLYGVPLFNYAMGLCDHGIASTKPLASRVEHVVRNHDCLVLRNGLDERNENAIDMGRAPRPKRDTVAIFYGSGTKAHNSDFNEIAGPALLSALERHANVRLIVVGYLRLCPAFDRFSSRILQLGLITDLDQYWSLLAASDINLAVLAPGLMASCKSEIKWLEAAVLQVPSIVSGTANYREILEDGVDALIVDSAAAWTEALERLIVDRNLRRSIGAAARRKVLQTHSLANAAKVLRDGLGLPIGGQEIVAPTTATMSTAKLKVLICNVFFPPQSRGGATRVVQDNVDYIKDECPDIDLSVFATDEGILPHGRFRFDQYRGVPVFRLSTPVEPNMDWRPFNTEHEEVFKRLLDAIQPNLIHFHCIQRLTASIVEIAFRRKIPYIITVHDGWWISDYQFFVDQDDILRLPSSDPFEGAPGPDIPLIGSIARRQRLAGFLDGAAKVLAVSDAFADIYRRAGCRNVMAIPNGVSPITPAPRRRNRDDGRLSLGHVGGRSAHKGATLVEAVLRMTHFDHLKLTMIDGTMQPGARSERIWGNTPVLLCGPYPQDQVAALYASLDVLLAPSIWPESFGLVAREAQVLGLWVIASDRGAVGEGIQHGENGFVIDVSDTRALTEVLKKLDADVVRYRAPPPRERAPMRTAADQGGELAELYRKTVGERNASISSSLQIQVSASDQLF